MNNKQHMNSAILSALQGIMDNDGGPFGSVIVKGDKVISVAHNTVLRDNDPTCHGEMNAIRAACKILGTHDLSGCELYTTAYPCPMCLGAIRWANIDKVYYGCRLEDTEKIGFRDLDFQDTEKFVRNSMSEVNRNECLDLFNKYVELDRDRY